MELAARTSAWSRKTLPYDTDVEYIESTGTQYIDTGVIPDINTKISVTAAVTATTEQFMGAINLQANRFHFSFYSGGFFRGCIGQLQIEMGHSDQLVHTLTIDAPNNTVSKDETSYSFMMSGLVPSISIWLFGRNSDNPRYIRLIKIRIYSCQIYQNGIIVSDFIPVRFINERGETEGAMFDRVSGQLYRNAGTGAFVIGPDKTT